MEVRSTLQRPLLIGRASRVVFGLAVIGTIFLTDILQISLLGALAILLLGVSFVLGGLLSIPGCELAALPNLLLPKDYRFTFP